MFRRFSIPYIQTESLSIRRQTPPSIPPLSLLQPSWTMSRIVGIVGQAGEKNGNLCLNRASESPRQPGSSIKPLSTYSLALEKNYVNWSSMILDYSIYQNGKLWPQNADGTNGSKKEITVQYAIQKSFNTVPVRIITEMLGVNEAYNFMKKTFHLTTLDDSADANIAPLATGALTNGVTTVEMAAAYAVFGNNGYYYELLLL